MKKYTAIIIIFITIILGFFVGLYLYKINQIDEYNLDIATKTIEDECTEEVKLYDIESIASIRTNSNGNKVSPNCILVIKKYYKDCNHTIQISEQIVDESLVNLTKKEFSEKYKEWEIKEFSTDKIIIYKEIEDFCNEHYVLKEKDGYLAIYKLNKQNKETLENITDIPTKYLPQSDVEEIKKGKVIYTKTELNKTIQDFE